MRLAGALALYAAAGAVVVLGLASIGQSRTIEAAPALTPLAAEKSSTGAAEPCAATMAEFYRLKMGMSYVEAKRVIGCDGEMISQLELSGINTATVKWEAAGNYFGSLIVTFQNNQLVSRSQFGLR
jgi:hypothetical protein